MTSSRIAVFNTLVLFSVRHIECFCTHRLSVTVAACLTFTHTHLSRTTAVSNWSLYQLALLQHTPFCGRPWLQRYDDIQALLYLCQWTVYTFEIQIPTTLYSLALKKTLQIWFKLCKSSSIMRLQHSQSGTRMHYRQILLLGGGMTIEFIEEEVKGGYSAFMLILAYIHFMLTHFPSKLWLYNTACNILLDAFIPVYYRPLNNTLGIIQSATVPELC